jgi:hypothetical protein
MSNGELILYTTEDGKTAIHLKAEGETVWLTQMELAELFQTTKQNISLHINNILSTNELSEAVVKDNLTIAADGKRYKTKLYNLSMILAIGYRVESQRGVQFRRWATIHLQEYLVKGFVMDDARLKDTKDCPNLLMPNQRLGSSHGYKQKGYSRCIKLEKFLFS